MKPRRLLDDFPLHLLEGPGPAAPILIVDDDRAGRLDLTRVPGADRLVILVSDDPQRLERSVRTLESGGRVRVSPLLAALDDPPVRAGSLGLLVVWGAKGRPCPGPPPGRYRRLLNEYGRRVQIVAGRGRAGRIGSDSVGPQTLLVRPASGAQYLLTPAGPPRERRPFASLPLGRWMRARLALDRFVARASLGRFPEGVALVVHAPSDPGASLFGLRRIQDPCIHVSAGRLALLMPASPRDIVVKCPLSLPIARRLEHQARALLRLDGGSALAPPRVVPRIVEHVTRGGQGYWVEERMSGRAATRGAWWPGRQRRIFRSAFEFLLQLHRTTAEATTLSPEVLDRLVSPGATLVEEEVGHVDKGFRVGRLVQAIRQIFVGREVPLVQTHGDFWTGNLLITGDGRLTGVVDWSDSVERGWPMLDLLHLLTMRVKWRGVHFFGRLVTRNLMPGRLGGWQEAMLDEYREALSIPADLWRGFVALYWLQRAGQELGEGYRGREAWIARNVVRTQTQLLRILQPNS